MSNEIKQEINNIVRAMTGGNVELSEQALTAIMAVVEREKDAIKLENSPLFIMDGKTKRIYPKDYITKQEALELAYTAIDRNSDEGRRLSKAFDITPNENIQVVSNALVFISSREAYERARNVLWNIEADDRAIQFPERIYDLFKTAFDIKDREGEKE